MQLATAGCDEFDSFVQALRDFGLQVCTADDCDCEVFPEECEDFRIERRVKRSWQLF